MNQKSSRLAFIDALKAMASQLIVLHHLAFYGPLSEAMHRAAPALFGWLASEARIAVQVFLVIGGFLAAKSLAPEGVLAAPNPLEQIKKRYFKLTLPFIVAVLVGMLFAALARQLFVDDAIPAAPTLWQFLSHAALLHGVLGFDSLSAGVWYVAIDFQLFALLLLTLWVARQSGAHAGNLPLWAVRERFVGLLLVAGLALLSVFHFNRQAEWDNWAIYFFGAYALGALAFWASRRSNSPVWLVGIGIVVLIALWLDFRPRILVALLTALALGAAYRQGWLEYWPRSTLLAWLGKISYSVFLIHFPLLLVINGIFAHFPARTPVVALAFAAIAWIGSITAGALFYRYVESRAEKWRAWLVASLRKLPARVFSA